MLNSKRDNIEYKILFSAKANFTEITKIHFVLEYRNAYKKEYCILLTENTTRNYGTSIVTIDFMFLERYIVILQ